MQNNELHFDIFMHPLIYWSSCLISFLIPCDSPPPPSAPNEVMYLHTQEPLPMKLLCLQAITAKSTHFSNGKGTTFHFSHFYFFFDTNPNLRKFAWMLQGSQCFLQTSPVPSAAVWRPCLLTLAQKAWLSLLFPISHSWKQPRFTASLPYISLKY